MASLLKVLIYLADIKSAGGVALRVRTQAAQYASKYLRSYVCCHPSGEFSSRTQSIGLLIVFILHHGWSGEVSACNGVIIRAGGMPELVPWLPR